MTSILFKLLIGAILGGALAALAYFMEKNNAS